MPTLPAVVRIFRAPRLKIGEILKNTNIPLSFDALNSRKNVRHL